MSHLRVFAPIALVAAVHSAMLATALPAFGSPATPATALPVATPPAAADPLAVAQQQYDDQSYAESMTTLQNALANPDATTPQKIAMYKLLFYNSVLLGLATQADGWVRHILVIDPTFDLPKTESPRFRDPFAASKKKWEGEGRPGLVVAPSEAAALVPMQHTSPAQADPSTQVSLLVRLIDPQHRVALVKLYFHDSGASKFEEAVAPLDASGAARASIPPSFVKAPFVEYYFTGFDKGGAAIAHAGDTSAPFRVAVQDANKGGGWLLPIAIGGGILGAAVIVGGLALAGVFKGSSGAAQAASSHVTISIGQ